MRLSATCNIERADRPGRKEVEAVRVYLKQWKCFLLHRYWTVDYNIAENKHDGKCAVCSSSS
jgi:hypothetical protein